MASAISVGFSNAQQLYLKKVVNNLRKDSLWTSLWRLLLLPGPVQMSALPSLNPGTRRFLHSCLFPSLWRRSGAAPRCGLPPQHRCQHPIQLQQGYPPLTAAPVPGQPHLPTTYLPWSSHSRGYQPVKARLRPWYKLVHTC